LVDGIALTAESTIEIVKMAVGSCIDRCILVCGYGRVYVWINVSV